MLPVLKAHRQKLTDTCVEKSSASVIIKGLEPYDMD
jgi:hypothetical protein